MEVLHDTVASIDVETFSSLCHQAYRTTQYGNGLAFSSVAGSRSWLQSAGENRGNEWVATGRTKDRWDGTTLSTGSAGLP